GGRPSSCGTGRTSNDGRAGEEWGPDDRGEHGRSQLARSASLGGTTRDEPDPSGRKTTMRWLTLIALAGCGPGLKHHASRNAPGIVDIDTPVAREAADPGFYEVPQDP